MNSSELARRLELAEGMAGLVKTKDAKRFFNAKAKALRSELYALNPISPSDANLSDDELLKALTA